MILTPAHLERARRHLIDKDPRLATVISRSPSCTIAPHTNYYQALVDSIISQQLSVKAAAAIEQRFCALFDQTTFPSPDLILGKTVDQLRGAGLSRAKANYVRDLAQNVVSGELQFNHFPELSNNAIIGELTKVKGIGEWTAHMFLIFCMGRSDVLAYGDLGILNGITKLYRLKVVADKAAVESVARQYNWQPYASVACWYIWQSLDNNPAVD